jgi:hypothetical protein
VAARTQSSKKCFQTATGTNSAFYMYERRYATEPFTAVRAVSASRLGLRAARCGTGRGGVVSALRYTTFKSGNEDARAASRRLSLQLCDRGFGGVCD